MEQKDDVEKMPFNDKVLAAATIENRPELFKQTFFSPEEILQIDAVLYEHLVTRGPHSLKLSVRIGRASKASLENPIKKKVTLTSKFKDFVKGILS